MGGLLLLCTLDHKQLQPVSGRPFLLSAHIISCYRFVLLKESVRASNDNNFQRIQNIVRMHPNEYERNPDLLYELSTLLRNNCTYVNSWSDRRITPDAFRLYGKKFPAKQASNDYINSVKQQLNNSDYIECVAEDIEKPHDSHQEWIPATERTKNLLDNQLKEQRKILFFKGALFQFTFNQDKEFSQSQLCLLLKIPTRRDLSIFKKIEVLVAPPGLKWTTYDSEKQEEEYIAEGWRKQLVGTSTDRTHRISSTVQAKRHQYGLKHHVTSTIHASMGDTISKIVTEICNSSQFHKLWDKAQVIVLLSRTRNAKDIIFVGNMESTIQSIIRLCKMSNQWTDYMELILEMASVNYIRNTNIGIPSIRRDAHPFRFCDRPLPQCNTGYVYMLISLRNKEATYIGMTNNITNRLHQHNSGLGTSFTASLRLQPWALFVYIVGFDSNRQLMFSLERKWKVRRCEERIRGVRCPKQIARLAYGLIEDVQNMNTFAYNNNDLRLVLNFED